MPYKSGRMPNNRIGKKQVVRYCHILMGSLQWQKRMPPLCLQRDGPETFGRKDSEE